VQSSLLDPVLEALLQEGALDAVGIGLPDAFARYP
jgi:hypothetical protein